MFSLYMPIFATMAFCIGANGVFWLFVSRSELKDTQRAMLSPGLWAVGGLLVAHRGFHNLPVTEVLAELDVVLLYVSNFAGRQVLVYWSDFHTNMVRWLCAPISDTALAKLRNNELTVYDALRGDTLFALDRTREGEVARAWQLPGNFGGVPESHRPTALTLRQLQGA